MKVLAGFVVLLFSAVVSAQNQNHLQKDPCNTKQGVVNDITHCDRYWECVEGQSVLYDCPNGLVFVGRNRGIAEGCDYPWRGSYCQSRTNPGTEKARANPPISTEHCDWLYGIFGHETSCTRYWTCWNGTSTEQFCIGGLLYNEESHSCDWPQNVQGCQKHPLCRDDPNANVPLGQSCERYWSCQGGYPRLQRCPATLVFDKVARRCLKPPTADCEAPPPPPPQEIDNQGFRIGGGPPRQTNPNRRRGSSTGVQQQVRQQFQGQDQQHQQSRPRPRPIEQEFIEPLQHQQQQQPRPRRPQISDLPGGSIPSGAVPINFSGGQIRRPVPGGNFRPAPIEGAIPFNN